MSVALHISGSIHHMIPFVMHKCKTIISPDFFHFFKILIFWVVRRVKGQKLTQNDKSSVAAYISGTMHHRIFTHGTHMMVTHKYHFQSVILCISGTVDHVIKIFGTQIFSLFFLLNTALYILKFTCVCFFKIFIDPKISEISYPFLDQARN